MGVCNGHGRRPTGGVTMSGTPELHCVACGRPMPFSVLARGRCPHCGAIHGLGADDLALAEAIFQTRAAAEAEREVVSESMTRTTMGFGRRLFAAHPLALVMRFVVREKVVHRDYHYVASLHFDGTYLDLQAPIRGERAALERAREVAEVALWTARVRRFAVPAHGRTRLIASKKFWTVPFLAIALMMGTAGNFELLWLSKIAGVILYVSMGVLGFEAVRERVRQAMNPHASALVRGVDPRLRPQPLGTARMICDWLGVRWAAPLGEEAQRALAGVSFTTRTAEGVLLRTCDPGGAPRLVVHVPFVCTVTPTSIQRRRGDALLAELEARGWRIDVDDKIGARASLAPAGADFQPSEVAALSDDLRRLCEVPEVLGGTSSLCLVTQALARVDSVAIHQAMQRHHAEQAAKSA